MFCLVLILKLSVPSTIDGFFFSIFGLFCFSAIARETSWKIKINDKKKKLMENILLYEEDKLNSSELFES